MKKANSPRRRTVPKARLPLDPAYLMEHRIDPFWGEEDETSHHPLMMEHPSEPRWRTPVTRRAVRRRKMA